MSIIIMGALGCIQTQAFDAKDIVIKAELGSNPVGLAEYTAIRNKIIDAFKKFLDKKDKCSYQHHLAHIEAAINELEQAIAKPELASARPQLEELHSRLTSLLATFKASTNAYSLAFKIKLGGFGDLLSSEVRAGRDEGDVIKVLQHRFKM